MSDHEKIVAVTTATDSIAVRSLALPLAAAALLAAPIGASVPQLDATPVSVTATSAATSTPPRSVPPVTVARAVARGVGGLVDWDADTAARHEARFVEFARAEGRLR